MGDDPRRICPQEPLRRPGLARLIWPHSDRHGGPENGPPCFDLVRVDIPFGPGPPTPPWPSSIRTTSQASPTQGLERKQVDGGDARCSGLEKHTDAEPVLRGVGDELTVLIVALDGLPEEGYLS